MLSRRRCGVDIVYAVGGRGVARIATGLTVALLGSLGFTREAETLVFGVTAGDATTFAWMAVVLALVSLLAFSIPFEPRPASMRSRRFDPE